MQLIVTALICQVYGSSRSWNHLDDLHLVGVLRMHVGYHSGQRGCVKTCELFN